MAAGTYLFFVEYFIEFVEYAGTRCRRNPDDTFCDKEEKLWDFCKIPFVCFALSLYADRLCALCKRCIRILYLPALVRETLI